MKYQLTPEGEKLFIDNEGLNQPYRWPGGNSGITLGYGYDLAHHTTRELLKDWGPFLTSNQYSRLCRAIGQSGINASGLAGTYLDIKITRNMALTVFTNASIPKYWALTQAAFPNVDKLCPQARDALLSLVYNRGSDTDGSNPRRKEMDNIEQILADGVQAGDYAAIARELRSMKRLWEGKHLDGLIRRREEEARLVESCIEKGATTP